MPLPPFEEHLQSPTEVVGAGAYYEIAFLGDDQLALAVATDRDADVILMDVGGRDLGRVDLPPRDESCVVRTVSSVVALPDGDLGFAYVCENDVPPRVTAELFAFNLDSGDLRSLGPVTQWPVAMTLNGAMSRVVYAASGDICATLYERDGREGPFEDRVTIRGEEVPLGEDLAASPDRCTVSGNANFPAFGPDGETLAVLVRPTGGADDQDRVDLPWALVIVTSDGSEVVIDGIVHPTDLHWLSSDELVFSGEIAGKVGLWTLRRDGTGLTRLGNEKLLKIAPAPDGSAVVALAPRGGLADLTTTVVRYDMTLAGASGGP